MSDNQLVNALKEGVQALKDGKEPNTTIITAGKLRERVRKGELKAKEVLAWLREQPGFSAEFETWLMHKASGFVSPTKSRAKKTSKKKKNFKEEEDKA